MSKKHEQRTRAEILAKRAIDPATWIEPVRKIIAGMPGPIVAKKPLSTNKFTPHFGAKQQAKLADKLPKATKLAA
ncbi:hypothetical protein G3N58_17765 [Paraburkholderia sp. Ac-20342]|uniref:hypothetical protein n=1 Tax=Paraburkholderia sp. Ac-20342 TaxID=2703889 RepID=UPI00198017EA|nr:hypothetical protein [Paraburkholderia sp. Ac-20342]MBN3848656.1 hypothetical protein [Paraburkholderia sp. Ac-20342]